MEETRTAERDTAVLERRKMAASERTKPAASERTGKTAGSEHTEKTAASKTGEKPAADACGALTGGSCCGCQKKYRTQEEYKALMNRLSRIEGQVRGIRQMVEEDRYCVDILTQVAAAKSALDGFGRVLLNQHIHTCVVDKIREGDDDEVIDELCGVVQKLMR